MSGVVKVVGVLSTARVGTVVGVPGTVGMQRMAQALVGKFSIITLAGGTPTRSLTKYAAVPRRPVKKVASAAPQYLKVLFLHSTIITKSELGPCKV